MTGGERYVTNPNARGGIKGRETEILDAFGIRWREGKPHINCPYPDHADNNPSWRWDRRKARAYCTCHTGGHSALDVIMNVEGIDFERAKIRAAELLNRSDLIRERRKKSRRGRWVLNPPINTATLQHPILAALSRPTLRQSSCRSRSCTKSA